MRLHFEKALYIGIVLVLFSGTSVFSAVSVDENSMQWGMPFGSDEAQDSVDEICPNGVPVISSFLYAWSQNNYEAMYDLLDPKSKADYSLQDAKLDFQFLEYKEYTISSVRKVGDTFEFIISAGDWHYGNRDTKKMILDGETFLIIMPTKNSPFKRSLTS